MRMKLAAFILLPLSLAACGEAKKGFDKGVEENFVKEFVDSCTVSATKTGMLPAVASKLCNCTAGKLVENNKGSALLNISNDEMITASKQCIAEKGSAG